jgi:Holliday junction resolvasome RuvABC ATP-dependent DNA helicase subunit
MKKRRDKSIEKNSTLVANPKAIREERVGAIEFFVGLSEAEKAVPALLRRFEYSLEHGINDTREKEAVMAGIINFGEKAAPLIAEHMRTTYRIAWPIKTYKKIADEQQVRAALVACLDFADVALDQHKVDKNYDILCYLHEYQLSEEMISSLFVFLSQHDERVRFAAVEALIEQQASQQAIARRLEPFLLDRTPENSRIHQAVVQAFLKHSWPLSDRQAFPEGPLGYGLVVTSDYRLQAGKK